MNRRFTFSDATLIQRLSQQFVPVSGDCSELQFGKTKTRDWIMSAVKKIDDAELRVQMNPLKDNTVQGLFVVGSDGTPYGWINTNDVKEVNDFLSRGLALFQHAAPDTVPVAPELVQEIWSQRPPAGGCVARVFSRISPLPPGCDPLNASIGRDHLWIYPAEIEEMIRSSAASTEFELPKNLVARLVRFHLIDNVRGEPDMWRPEEIRMATFLAHTVNDGNAANRETSFAGNDGNSAIREISFEGVFSQSTANDKRRLSGKLTGIIKLDTISRTITAFRAFGRAQAWGRSTFTPKQPRGRFPIIFAMIETGDQVAVEVPPEAVSYDYEQPQIAASASMAVSGANSANENPLILDGSQAK